MKPITVDQSKIGARVCLSGAKHIDYRDMCGIVKRAVKSRDCYTVLLDDGRRYDADPDRVTFI